MQHLFYFRKSNTYTELYLKDVSLFNKIMIIFRRYQKLPKDIYLAEIKNIVKTLGNEYKIEQMFSFFKENSPELAEILFENGKLVKL